MPVMPSRSFELPDVRHPAARDGRLVVPLDQQQPHAVGEVFLDDRNLLRRQRQRPVQEQNQGKPSSPASDARADPPGLFKVCHARETTLSRTRSTAKSKSEP